MRVIARVLGVPEQDADQFRKWIQEISSSESLTIRPDAGSTGMIEYSPTRSRYGGQILERQYNQLP